MTGFADLISRLDASSLGTRAPAASPRPAAPKVARTSRRVRNMAFLS